MSQMNYLQQKFHDEAVDWFLNSSEQLFEIAGAAGTGKTFLIFEILRSLGLRPENYLAMTYTGQAAIVMRTRGFMSARTIHSSLYEVIEYVDNDNINTHFGTPVKKKSFRKREFIDPNIRLFFIDEAWMVPDYMVRDIKSFGIKIITCGDPNQLPPVGANPGFLINSNIHMLTEIMRQSLNNPIVYLANRILKGQPIHCGIYGNSVLVIEEDEFDERMIGLVDVVGVCTNNSRKRINSRVRQICGYESPLPYHGERIICNVNDWNIEYEGISLANGLSGTMYGMPKMNPKDNQTFFMDFAPDYTHYVFPNLCTNIEYFSANQDRQNDMRSLVKSKFNNINGLLFDYGYASTIWKLQGSEYDNVLYMEEFLNPQLKRACDYTAVTRAKQKLIIVKQKIKLHSY